MSLLWEMLFKDCLEKMPLHIIAVTPGKTPAQPEITSRHTSDRQKKSESLKQGDREKEVRGRSSQFPAFQSLYFGTQTLLMKKMLPYN